MRTHVGAHFSLNQSTLSSYAICFWFQAQICILKGVKMVAMLLVFAIVGA
jgi:hypothetical protein